MDKSLSRLSVSPLTRRDFKLIVMVIVDVWILLAYGKFEFTSSYYNPGGEFSLLSFPPFTLVPNGVYKLGSVELERVSFRVS